MYPYTNPYVSPYRKCPNNTCDPKPIFSPEDTLRQYYRCIKCGAVTT